MSHFNLDIFTPNGVLVHKLACNELIIPTKVGEINVLPEHTHLISELDTGILVAKVEHGTRHFAVHEGLCKILGSSVTVLSYTSERAEDIDFERAKTAKAKAESRLEGLNALSEVEYIKFRRKLDRANIRIKMAEFYKQ